MARLTRRQMAALLTAAPLAAQNAPPPKETQPEMAPKTVQQAMDQVKQTREKLQNLSVPTSLEPAFAFKV
jgi:hypothetical protein